MNVKRAFTKNNITNPLYVAGNGLEALDLLRGDGPNRMPAPRIILLDLNMPRMGGIEFLRELRADPELRGTSVFVMTTSNEDKDKVDAYNLRKTFSKSLAIKMPRPRPGARHRPRTRCAR